MAQRIKSLCTHTPSKQEELKSQPSLAPKVIQTVVTMRTNMYKDNPTH